MVTASLFCRSPIRRRRPTRPVSCATKLLGELPAGCWSPGGRLRILGNGPPAWSTTTATAPGSASGADLLAATGQLVLNSAEPLAPLTLIDLRSRVSWRLWWPSQLRGGTHIAAVRPNGRDIAVGFHGLAAPGEEGYDLWLLNTATRPGAPARPLRRRHRRQGNRHGLDGDGRLVVLTGRPPVARWLRCGGPVNLGSRSARSPCPNLAPAPTPSRSGELAAPAAGRRGVVATVNLALGQLAPVVGLPGRWAVGPAPWPSCTGHDSACGPRPVTAGGG